jgi:hypothetical protein
MAASDSGKKIGFLKDMIWPQGIEYSVLLHDGEHVWSDDVPVRKTMFFFGGMALKSSQQYGTP